MTPTSVLSLVTLFLNNSIVNDLDNYEPKYTKPAYYYFYNNNGSGENPAPVKYDPNFANSIVFPKCCPPGFLFKSENRDCVEAHNVSQIYEDLNINVNLVKYGLYECPVVIDRLIDKDILKISNGEGNLVIDGETFENRRFCIDKISQNNDSYIIRLCQEREYCLDGVKNDSRDWCVYKCCPDTDALIDYVCDQTTKMGLSVKKYKNIYESVDGYGFLYGDNLTCNVANWIDMRKLNFTIKTNGSLFRSDESTEYKVNEYCLDTMYNTKAKTYTDFVIICEFDKVLYAKWAVLRVAVVLTCICLVVTIAVYVFVHKMRKLVEKIITSFCVVNLIFWILYALRIFYMDFGGFCTQFGYIYFFIMLSRLAWLNVFSYEIWVTLGRTRVKVGETPEVLRKKFIYYCIYAVTLPSLCTFFFILADQEIYELPKTIKPYINPAGCAIDTSKIGNYGHYLYLYMPIWTLVIANLVFYVKTVLHFLEIKNDLKKISGPATSQNRKDIRNNNKHGFIILKLGLVMGITWIYHIFDYLNSFESIWFSRTIGDILRFSNILEGVYFLMIFVVKWKIVREILHKLNILKKTRYSSSASTESTGSLSISNQEVTNAIPMETLNSK